MLAKFKGDFWTGLIYLAVGASVILIARNYSVGTASRMGPGYFSPSPASWSSSAWWRSYAPSSCRASPSAPSPGSRWSSSSSGRPSSARSLAPWV